MSINLTGGQIQEVLDNCIMQAVRPLVLYSDIFDTQLTYIVNAAATNKKRKVSALDRECFINTVCCALVEQDRERKWNLITSAKIERQFIYMFVVKFLKETADYDRDYSRYVTATSEFDINRFDEKLALLENSIGIPREHMIMCRQTCNDYLELAYTFRNKIVSQYVKLCYKNAAAYCKDKPNYDRRDVAQNFITAVTKALDKYDSSKGALTSYINYWIYNAQTYGVAEHGHEYGIAYTIPQGKKRAIAKDRNTASDNNFSVSLDQLVGEDSELIDMFDSGIDHNADRERSEESRMIQYIVKHADENGMARLYLGIDEYFSDKELMEMERHMIDEHGLEQYKEMRFNSKL